MRITSDQLRRIIREEIERSIDEMAFAGQLGTVYADDPGEGFFSDGEDEDPAVRSKDRSGAFKYSRSKLFTNLAIKHYANLPFNVWTATVIGRFDITHLDGWKRAAVIDLFPDGLDTLESMGIESSNKISPDDFVILYGATTTAKDFNASPWMILHGFFDQSSDFENICPTFFTLREIGDYSLPEVLDDVPAQDFYDLVARAQEFFTMRSARIGAISGGDSVAEAVTQELLDRRGFHVNSEAVPPELASALRVFTRLVKTVGEEFRQNAPGKMLVVRSN